MFQASYLVLLVLILTLTNCNPVSISIGNLEYQTWSISEEVKEGPLYWESPCDNNIQASIDPICNNEFCFTDEKYRLSLFEEDTNVLFESKISNYDICTSSFIVSIHLDYGLDIAVLKAGNFNHVLYDSSKYWLGVIPVSICCSDLREIAGNEWDGSFSIEFVLKSSKLSLTLLTPKKAEVLPIYDYYQLVPVFLECDGEVIECLTGTCVINVLPSSDPNYSFWSETIKNLIGDVEIVLPEAKEDRVSSIIWISRLAEGHSQKSGLFGIPDGVEVEKCKIVYGNLEKRERTQIINKNRCTAEEYLGYYTSFENLLKFLQSNPVFEASDSIFLVSDLIQVLTKSISWSSCLDLAHSLMVENEINETLSYKECDIKDTDPNYLLDPCCNKELQLYKCCREKQKTITKKVYTYRDVEDCSYSSCLLNPLKNLERSTSVDFISKCSSDRLNVLNNEAFKLNPFKECLLRSQPKICSFTNQCEDIPSSTCSPFVRYCTIPCDDYCYNGECVDGFCINLSSNKETISESIYQCVLDKIDPYLAILIKEEVLLSNYEGTDSDKFLSLVMENKCTTVSGEYFDNEYMTEQECIEYSGYCKVLSAKIGASLLGTTIDGSPDLLTPERCNLRVLNSIDYGFCGYESLKDFGIVPFSRPNICEARIQDSLFPDADLSEYFCKIVSLGDTWNGRDYQGNRPFGGCLHQAFSESSDECYSSVDCLGIQYKDEECVSYCYDSSIFDSISCQNLGNTWYDFPSKPGGRCVVELTYTSCINSGYTWVTGRSFLPEIYNSPEDCPKEVCYGYFNNEGFKWDITDMDQCVFPTCSSCESGSNEPQCFSQEICEKTMSCDNPTGCLIPKILQQILGYKFPCIFYPKELCFVGLNKFTCEITGFSYASSAMFPDEESCKQSMEICNDGSIPDGSFRGASEPQPQYSYRNKEECEACGGHIETWWNWTASKWGPKNVIYHPQWFQSTITESIWSPRPSNRLFEKMLDRVRVRRLSSIISSELYCNYGIESDVLVYVSCSCSEDGVSQSCYETLTSLSGSSFSEVSVCEGINLNKEFDNIHIFSDNFTTTSEKNKCLSLKLDLLPKEQFIFKEKDITSSLAIVSESETARLSSIYVYNKNNIVVGQIYSDGYLITLGENVSFSGVKICIRNKNVLEWSLERIKPKYLDIVVSNSNDFNDFSDISFEAIGLNADYNSSFVCTEILPSNKAYFLAGLTDNWENLKASEMWTTSELGLMVFCSVAFIILFIWTTWSLGLRIRNEKLKRFPRPEICLLSLVILSCLGAIYQIGSIFDAYGSNLRILFTDVPQLCLITCITITCAMWQSLTAAVELKSSFWYNFVPILFLLILYILFIALMTTSIVLDKERFFTCASTEDEKLELTVSQKLSMSYKSIYAFYTSVITLMYLIAGIKLIKLLKDSDFKDILIKSSAATAVATTSLFVTVAISAYSVQHTLSNTTKLAFTIAVLILPGYVLSYLYSYRLGFTSLVNLTKLSKGKSELTGTPDGGLSGSSKESKTHSIPTK